MITLYQFQISHYCEKVRWALDIKGIDYRVKNYLPGFHLKPIKKITGKATSMPLIEHHGKLIQGSANIIDYLDELVPEPRLTPPDEAQAEQARAWEAELDEALGDHVRRYTYHYFLDQPKVILPMLQKGSPWLKQKLYQLAFPKIVPIMRRYMVINDESAAKSEQIIQDTLEKLSQHYQQYEFLVGDGFSRADLTAAALAAPLTMPKAYGVPEPSHMPQAIAEFIDRNQENLAYIEHFYSGFRTPNE